MSDNDDPFRVAKDLAIQRIKDAADSMIKGAALMTLSALIMSSAWYPTRLYFQVPAFVGGIVVGLFAIQLLLFSLVNASFAFYPFSGKDPKKMHVLLEYVVVGVLTLSIIHMVLVSLPAVLEAL